MRVFASSCNSLFKSLLNKQSDLRLLSLTLVCRSDEPIEYKKAAQWPLFLASTCAASNTQTGFGLGSQRVEGGTVENRQIG